MASATCQNRENLEQPTFIPLVFEHRIAQNKAGKPTKERCQSFVHCFLAVLEVLEVALQQLMLIPM